jgi:hypothetical protein
MALGSTQPLVEMNTRNIFWEGRGKCVRCVGLTNLILLRADYLENWDPQPRGTLRACFTFFPPSWFPSRHMPILLCPKLLFSNIAHPSQTRSSLVLHHLNFVKQMFRKPSLLPSSVTIQRLQNLFCCATWIQLFSTPSVRHEANRLLGHYAGLKKLAACMFWLF